MLLVRMREQLQAYGIEESSELPDHITHVLQLIAAMPRPEADRFVPSCVYPSIVKMHTSAERIASPYRHLIGCLKTVLEHEWGPLLDASPEDTSDLTQPGVDPLHAFPVLLDDGGCSECDPTHESCTEASVLPDYGQDVQTPTIE